MMKIQYQVKTLYLIRFVLLLFAGSTSVMADTQPTGNKSTVDLPEIITGFEIKLENLFRQSSTRQVDDAPNSGSVDGTTNLPMQLVGTLIMPEKRIAWIKTHQSQIYNLEEDQPVPGTQLRVHLIHSNSVELVNTGSCIKNTSCYPDLILELN